MNRYWSLLILFVLLILSWLMIRKLRMGSTTQLSLKTGVDGIVWTIVDDHAVRHSSLVTIWHRPSEADQFYPNWYQFIRLKHVSTDR